MRLIPKKLLIHQAVAERSQGLDPDGEPLGVESWELKNVRIEATRGVQRLDVGETQSDTLTLFYDPVQSASEPAGYIPQELDKLKWNGNEYTLRNIRILYTQGADVVHHYEGGLV